MTRSSRTNRLGKLSYWLSTLTAVAFLPSIVTAQALTLYHPFPFASHGRWQPVTIRLDPTAWRVGASDGPAATDAELRAVLADLRGLTIGASRRSAVRDNVSYPCAIALTEVQLAQAPVERFDQPAMRWDSTYGATTWQGPDRGTPGRILAVDQTSTVLLEAARFVGLHAPAAFIGASGLSLGQTISFRIRAESNSIVPSNFDPSGGRVVLSNQPPSPLDNQPIESQPKKDDERSAALGDDFDAIDRVMSAWMQAFHAQDANALSALYHPAARLFDGALAREGANPIGLARHLRRTAANAHSPTWRVVSYAVRTEGTRATCDIAFDAQSADRRTSVLNALERGTIRFYLTRYADQWVILSHGPWTTRVTVDQSN